MSVARGIARGYRQHFSKRRKMGSAHDVAHRSDVSLRAAGVVLFAWVLASIERLGLGSLASSAALIGALAVAAIVVLCWPQKPTPIAWTLHSDAVPDHGAQRLDLSS